MSDTLDPCKDTLTTSVQEVLVDGVCEGNVTQALQLLAMRACATPPFLNLMDAIFAKHRTRLSLECEPLSTLLPFLVRTALDELRNSAAARTCARRTLKRVLEHDRPLPMITVMWLVSGAVEVDTEEAGQFCEDLLRKFDNTMFGNLVDRYLLPYLQKGGGAWAKAMCRISHRGCPRLINVQMWCFFDACMVDMVSRLLAVMPEESRPDMNNVFEVYLSMGRVDVCKEIVAGFGSQVDMDAIFVQVALRYSAHVTERLVLHFEVANPMQKLEFAAENDLLGVCQVMLPLANEACLDEVLRRAIHGLGSLPTCQFLVAHGACPRKAMMHVWQCRGDQDRLHEINEIGDWLMEVRFKRV